MATFVQSSFSSWRDYLGLATLVSRVRHGHELLDSGGEPKDDGLFLQGRHAAGWGMMVEPRVAQKYVLSVGAEQRICVFCRNNKEMAALYSTHALKGPDGKVQCPVLRRYICPLCGASGDQAHTIKYCPISRAQDKTRIMQNSSLPQANGRESLGHNPMCNAFTRVWDQTQECNAISSCNKNSGTSPSGIPPSTNYQPSRPVSRGRGRLPRPTRGKKMC